MYMITINENIHKITLPYKDIFTTVCTLETEDGVLLFDAASFPEDAEGYILPMLEKLGVGEKELKYIFISHNHNDHAGALRELLERFPDVTVLSRSKALKEKYPEYKVYAPGDGEVFLKVLRVVTIPGHTEDSAAILDTRSNTLVTGDCLQLYGIFGSGAWGANISLPVEHIEAVEKVRALGVDAVCTAHDYHPCGTFAKGEAEVNRMLDSCLEPIETVKRLVRENPGKEDAEIGVLYNSMAELPRLNTKLVAAVRDALAKGRM